MSMIIPRLLFEKRNKEGKREKKTHPFALPISLKKKKNSHSLYTL
jgi:hypothetical protein